jgi:hypothetical protein
MMLKSHLLSGNGALELCAVKDLNHIMRGDSGVHVGKIQAALVAVDDAKISAQEWNTNTYGPSTEHAVLKYKEKRQIINKSYQKIADAIVGRMTIASLDAELLRIEKSKQNNSDGSGNYQCSRCGKLDSTNTLKLLTASNRISKINNFFSTLLLDIEKENGSEFLKLNSIKENIQEKKSKDALPVIIGDANEGWYTQDDDAYQMIPMGEKRILFGKNYNSESNLIIPKTLTVDEGQLKFKFSKKEDSTVSVYSVPKEIADFEIPVTGAKAGLGYISLRKKNEFYKYDAKRDLTVTVKNKIQRKLFFIVPTDAATYRSTITKSQLETAFNSVQRFYKVWCNIELALGGIVELHVDEALGSEVDYTNHIVRKDSPALAALGGSRLLTNDHDDERGERVKIAYVLWKLKVSDPSRIAIEYQNRIFLQDKFTDFSKWIISLAHELGHSFGVPGHPHPDPAGFLMHGIMEGIAPKMSLKCIEICNPKDS